MKGIKTDLILVQRRLWDLQILKSLIAWLKQCSNLGLHLFVEVLQSVLPPGNPYSDLPLLHMLTVKSELGTFMEQRCGKTPIIKYQ